jgi:transcriptional regulator with XRE-family HTH domain
MPKAAASPGIDAIMGQILRERRRAMGLTLAQVASAAGITYQQVGKYETGTDRLSIARLAQISGALRVHPAEMLRAAVEAAGSPDPMAFSPRPPMQISRAAAELPLPAQRHLAMFLRALRNDGAPKHVADRWAGRLAEPLSTDGDGR